MTSLELKRLELYIKALKMIPRSPVQNKVREEINEITKRIDNSEPGIFDKVAIYLKTT